MGAIMLPYEVEPTEETHGGDPFACTLYKMLPKKMQKTTRGAVHLMEYLHKVPVNDEYYYGIMPANGIWPYDVHTVGESDC